MALPVVALVAQSVLWRPLVSPLVWFLFYPAVFASAWIAGRKGGLAATFLSVLLAWTAFVEPQGVLLKGNARAAFSALVFTVMGVAFSEVNERLRRSRARLERANARVEGLLEESRVLDRLKSEFFANVSHELRTPLTLILGPVRQLLDSSELAESERDQLSLVERNAELLLGQVEELLEAASLESGAATHQPVSTDLAALVRLVVGQFAGVAHDRAVTVTVEAEPVVAVVDPAAIQRALTNLVGNAFKFTPRGGHIRVTLGRQDDAAVIEVADSGPGVAIPDRQLIFERFRQASGGPTRRHGGVGLGLAIVKDIATLHGGTIGVRDAPGGGALFALTLPLAPAGSTPVPAVPLAALPDGQRGIAALAALRPAREPRTDAAPTGRGSVLVIEDDPDLNAFLCQGLSGFYDVIAAFDGAQGTAAALEHHPTVIVTDLMMPGTSGHDLVRDVRALPELAHTPILVLTAKDDRAVMVRLLREGANDYVVKPFSIDELHARLENLVRLRLVELERQRAHERAESFLQAAPDATVVVDTAGTIVFANQKAETVFGYRLGELVGQPVEMLLPLDGRAAHPGLREGFMRDPRARPMGSGLELSARRKDGSLLPVDVSLAPVSTADGAQVIASVRDVSLQRSAQQQLRHLALHDALTGLPNRTLLLEHLAQKLGDLNRVPGCVAVLFVDLDRFKQVNDQQGHTVGDTVLRQVASRLQDCVRANDTVGRIGGDEFVIACGLLADESEALVLAERVEAAFQQPITIGAVRLPIGASVGVAIARTSDVTPDDLLRHADTAMYQAKSRGRGRVEVFDQQLRRLVEQRAGAETLLRDALAHDRLRLLYQPVVDLRTHQVRGVEGLLRVEDEDGTLVTPEVFQAVAEDTGMIVPIGRWVIEQACRQLAVWQRGGWTGRVWVNASPQQLHNETLVHTVQAALRESGADPRRLGLEITETTFMEATPTVLARLTELTDLGLRLAIDDFGTGWSSLASLKNLPVDTLKIDRSFTQGLGIRSEDGVIVSTVVRLAQALGREVVIEGIETAQQLALAARAGCTLAQGFLFAPPLEAVEICDFDPTASWPPAAPELPVT